VISDRPYTYVIKLHFLQLIYVIVHYKSAFTYLLTYRTSHIPRLVKCCVAFALLFISTGCHRRIQLNPEHSATQRWMARQEEWTMTVNMSVCHGSECRALSVGLLG